MTRFFFAGLLTCLLIKTISADLIKTDTLKYKFKAQKFISLEPCSWNQTATALEADVYLIPVKDDKNSFSITVRNLTLQILRNERRSINFVKCLSAASSSYWLEQPYMATFTENGVLKSISVSENEPELSKNLKLLTASLFQLDLVQLKTLTCSHTKRNEPSYAGICPTRYDIVGQNQDGTVEVKKIVDWLNCDDVVRDIRSDGFTCLFNTCRRKARRNLQWTGNFNASVKEYNGQFIIERMIADVIVSYNPYVASKLKTISGMKAEGQLLSISHYPDIPSYQPSSDTVTICKPIYRSINRGICLTPANIWNVDLKESYNALICEQPYSSLFEDIIEKTLLCNYRV